MTVEGVYIFVLELLNPSLWFVLFLLLILVCLLLPTHYNLQFEKKKKVILFKRNTDVLIINKSSLLCANWDISPENGMKLMFLLNFFVSATSIWNYSFFCFDLDSAPNEQQWQLTSLQHSMIEQPGNLLGSNLQPSHPHRPMETLSPELTLMNHDTDAGSRQWKSHEDRPVTLTMPMRFQKSLLQTQVLWASENQHWEDEFIFFRFPFFYFNFF